MAFTYCTSFPVRKNAAAQSEDEEGETDAGGTNREDKSDKGESNNLGSAAACRTSGDAPESKPAAAIKPQD